MSREAPSPFAKCKKCGRPVVWIGTRKGKRVPVLRLRLDGTETDPRDTYAQANHEVHFSSECPGLDPHQRELASAPPPKILGLTLWQPWAYAVAYLGKRIENRDWEPWCPPGTWIAIHAGQRYDEDGARSIRERLRLTVPTSAACHRGAIVAVGRYVGVVREPCDDPWFIGPVGLRLDQVTAIAPVNVGGAQKLWRLPPPVLEQVRAAWAEARRAAPERRVETIQPEYPWSDQ